MEPTKDAAPAPVAGPPPDKRPQVEKLLTDILGMLGAPARLEFKDLTDGTLGVALHFPGEVPGAGAKRNLLVESLQFLLNKAINRPNLPRRWVTLGVQGFPEPRAPQGQGGQHGAGEAKADAKAAAPVAGQAPAGQRANGSPPTKPGQPAQAQGRNGQKGPQEKGRHEQRPQRAAHVDESTLEVAEDPTLSKLAKTLAERAAKLGRTYGLMLLTPEDRARVLKAVAGMPGVRMKTEGEAHWRRVVFVPEKPVPLSKKMPMPDYDDEEE